MVTTRSTPDSESPDSSRPPNEVLIETIDEHKVDDGSISSAPAPSTGVRFRTKPTPKKVVFDAMNWLAGKTAMAATAAATATASGANPAANTPPTKGANPYASTDSQ